MQHISLYNSFYLVVNKLHGNGNQLCEKWQTPLIHRSGIPEWDIATSMCALIA